MNYTKIQVNEINPNKKGIEFITEIISKMNDEFNLYINAYREIPWWNTERTMVAFFLAAIIRNTQNPFLMEFNDKSEDDKSEDGIIDLSFKYNGQDYLLEAKNDLNTKLGTTQGFNKAGEWAKDALNQAVEYIDSTPSSNRIGICFESPYYSDDPYGPKYDRLIERWADHKKAFGHLDFYAFVHLTEEVRKKKVENVVKFTWMEKSIDYHHPGVAIYGLFNR